MLANEAAFALGEGTADETTIDLAMKLGANYPVGPLEWMHRIGPDKVLRVLEHLRAVFAEERYRVAPLLRRWAQTAGKDSDTMRRTTRKIQRAPAAPSAQVPAAAVEPARRRVSWVDASPTAIDRSPVPPWLVYPLLFAALLAILVGVAGPLVIEILPDLLPGRRSGPSSRWP